VISVTDYDPSAERQMVKSLLSWRPAAIVLIGLEHEFETIRLLRNSGTIVVEILDVDGAAIDISVGMSHLKAGREMAAFLLNRGHRAFGYVGHNIARDPRAAKRKQGFLSALTEAGGRLVDEIISTGHPPVQVGRAGIAELLAKSPEITAVYFSDDELAIGGVFHCMAESISIPERMAIAGFSGINLGQALPRPLTTTQALRFEMGSLAGKYIVARLDGMDVPDHTDVGFRLLPGATA
jgi:LacI family gluconate utilization system Gnt-I transcriptional repressor